MCSGSRRSHRYRGGMSVKELTAQEQAERVLAQIEAALRVAAAGGAAPGTIDELRAIHRRLHQQGLRTQLQGSIF